MGFCNYGIMRMNIMKMGKLNNFTLQQSHIATISNGILKMNNMKMKIPNNLIIPHSHNPIIPHSHNSEGRVIMGFCNYGIMRMNIMKTAASLSISQSHNLTIPQSAKGGAMTLCDSRNDQYENGKSKQSHNFTFS